MVHAKFDYDGSTPGADASTYKLLDTTEVFQGKNGFAHAGIETLVLSLDHSHGGTLKRYKSQNRGTTWVQIGEEAVAAPAASSETLRTYTVSPYQDFKLDWVNGGSAQTTWLVDIAGSDELV